jgi:hypothetical protein
MLLQFAYDTDPTQSAEKPGADADMLAANWTSLLTYHFAWTGVGHVAKAGSG